MINGQCMQKDAVDSMSYTECDEVYAGEIERPVREQFQEHYRDA